MAAVQRKIATRSQSRLASKQTPDPVVDTSHEGKRIEDSLKYIVQLVLGWLPRIKWTNFVYIVVWHVLAFNAYRSMFVNEIKLNTLLFNAIYGLFGGLGILAGAHRLWSHKAFKARFPLKIFLSLFHTTTMNGSSFSYARDHRTHHKFSDTEGDPKNPTKGLFHSHIGWWMLKKPQSVLDHGNKLDFSDLTRDPVVAWERKYYWPLFTLLGLAVPILVPHLFWGESLFMAFNTNMLRITIILHHYFTVNSFAHFFGYRPYDFRIRPAENRMVMYLSMGEGNHNYHHVFPYDYKSAELKGWEYFNLASAFIDICYYLGLAYDLKTASKEAIEGAVQRSGGKVIRDAKLSLPLRILNGIIDWNVGLAVGFWYLFPIFLYKFATGNPFFA